MKKALVRDALKFFKPRVFPPLKQDQSPLYKDPRDCKSIIDGPSISSIIDRSVDYAPSPSPGRKGK